MPCSYPTITAVIPTHNRLASVCRAIDSVLAQNCPALELIVVDDGSDDGTSNWISTHYPDVTLITQTNQGVSHARNRAIERASGEWIALLDSDDRWYPDKLRLQMEAIRAFPAFRLCHCDEHWLRNGRRVNPKQKHRKHGGDVFQYCLPLCAISPSASLIHVSLLADVGLFDETLPACEDYDLWLRISCREEVLYVDQPLLEKTGGHDDQLSRRYPAMDQYRLQALAKLIRSGKLSNEQEQLALTTFRQKLVIYRQGALKRSNTEVIEQLQHTYQDLIDRT